MNLCNLLLMNLCSLLDGLQNEIVEQLVALGALLSNLVNVDEIPVADWEKRSGRVVLFRKD